MIMYYKLINLSTSYQVMISNENVEYFHALNFCDVARNENIINCLSNEKFTWANYSPWYHTLYSQTYLILRQLYISFPTIFTKKNSLKSLRLNKLPIYNPELPIGWVYRRHSQWSVFFRPGAWHHTLLLVSSTLLLVSTTLLLVSSTLLLVTTTQLLASTILLLVSTTLPSGV